MRILNNLDTSRFGVLIKGIEVTFIPDRIKRHRHCYPPFKVFGRVDNFDEASVVAASNKIDLMLKDQIEDIDKYHLDDIRPIVMY